MVVAVAELDLDLDAPEERRAWGGRRAGRRRARARRRRGRRCGRPRPSRARRARSSPRKSSTVIPRAGSPRSVSRTCVEMLTIGGIVFLPGGRARALPDPLRGRLRARADRAGRGRVGRDGDAAADPRLHVRPDLLDARPQPPAHRGGRPRGARRGRPPELVDALRARARARRAARRASSRRRSTA